ncbi:MAG: Nif3-like dinuclear metal center hexameric protein [Thiohalomonadales bacterium]
MPALTELVSYCDNLLSVNQFHDYCPNGLQVQGRENITKIVSGVSACQALLDAAVAEKADLILVHHGYFWKGEDPCVVSLKYRRLKRLLTHDIGLLAYHLPLDAHPELGNNAQLAQLCGFIATGRFGKGAQDDIGWRGELSSALLPKELHRLLSNKLGREALHINVGDRPIKTLAWCTGGAQSYINEAVQLGVDAFISGEISEQTVHIARESGVHYFAAGHHATERYGVQALGCHLAKKFDIDHQFIDIDNPV